jgi:GxxExxY protein
MEENVISGIIVDAAIEVHRTLGGSGLLESVYHEALTLELRNRGLEVQTEKSVPIVYKGVTLHNPLKLDLLVGNKVIVECKAVTKFHRVFQSQTLTYLRLTGVKLGLIINFGALLLKHGIYRVVNGLEKIESLCVSASLRLCVKNFMLSRIQSRLSLTLSVLLRGGRAFTARTDIPSLTPEEVDEARSFFPRPKFFVYGHARSGTTLLMRLLDAHPDVYCTRQAHFFSRPPFLQALVSDPDVAFWLQRGSFRWNRGKDLSPVVLRAAADFILERDAAAAGASIVGDKSPNSINDGEAIDLTHRIYPDARIIYIIRDGRDAVLSHRFQAFIDAPQHLTRADLGIRAEFQRDPDRFRSADKSLFTEKGIRAYAQGWVRNVETSVERGQALYGERFHTLRFEDLVADPSAETTAAWAFLGADPMFKDAENAIQSVAGTNRDAKWQEKKAGGLAEEIPKGQRGSWEAFFSARDVRVFDETAGETLKFWGFK